jgi:2-dehydro-3-deoxyphosphogluconate aldolase / (4S)-4-hydroxy-2-oxoglutarate aldolase
MADATATPGAETDMALAERTSPMTKEHVRDKIHEVGILPGVRTSSAEDARFAAETIAKAGIPIVEITMTVPGALDVISDLVHNLPQVIVGAGTVLDIETARLCLRAGARDSIWRLCSSRARKTS